MGALDEPELHHILTRGGLSPHAATALQHNVPRLGRGMYDNGNSGDVVPPGNFPLRWAITDGPQHQDDLLDLTDSVLPAVRESGVYVVQGSVSVASTADTPGSFWGFGVDIDFDGDDPNIQFGGLLFDNALQTQSFNVIYYCPASGTLRVTLGNTDTVAHTVFMAVFLQQIA